MGGCTDFYVHVIEGGIQTSGVTIHPAPVPGWVERRRDEFLTFTGSIGVSADTDALILYRNACLNADEYVTNVSHNGSVDRLVLDAARSRAGRPGWAAPTPTARSTYRLRSSTSRSKPRVRARADRTRDLRNDLPS
jgi:hypothetical protein